MSFDQQAKPDDSLSQEATRYLINDFTVEFKGDNLPPLWENVIGVYHRYK